MVIEYARNVAGLEKAASTEFDPDAPEPVIATMEEQKSFVEGAGDLGGTMRLGLYPADAQGGHGRAGGVRRGADRGAAPAPLRGQQRATATSSSAAGLVFSGTSPDNNLVEFVELPRDVHPYYVSTQAHPELRSRPTRPHPLFAGLVGAAIERQRELRFPIDESGLRRKDDDRGLSRPSTSQVHRRYVAPRPALVASMDAHRGTRRHSCRAVVRAGRRTGCPRPGQPRARSIRARESTPLSRVAAGERDLVGPLGELAGPLEVRLVADHRASSLRSSDITASMPPPGSRSTSSR